MAEPFLGEIRLFPYATIPKGWAQCNGQLLPIKQYQALCAVIGARFGGDGKVTFGLPDLRGRVPLATVTAAAVPVAGGEETHTLLIAEIPSHVHELSASQDDPSVSQPGGAIPATSKQSNFVPAGTDQLSAMSAGALATAGAGAPHNNLQPFLVLNYCIALEGYFPSRN